MKELMSTLESEDLYVKVNRNQLEKEEETLEKYIREAKIIKYQVIELVMTMIENYQDFMEGKIALSAIVKYFKRVKA